MIIEFRFGNFRSFRDQQVLSLVASSDKSLEQNTFTAGGMRLLRSAAIYGPNASGKSNLVSALLFLSGLVEHSADLGVGKEIDLSPFRLDRNRLTEPTFFELTLLREGTRFRYGFTVSRRKVRQEWLYAYPHGREQMWFERGGVRSEQPWVFGTHLKGDKHRLARLTKENSLFLSVAGKLNNEQLTPLCIWFGKRMLVIPAGAPVRSFADWVLDGTRSADGLTGDVSLFLKSFDVGIERLETRRRKATSPELIPPASDSLSEREKKIRASLLGVRMMDVVTYHPDASGRLVPFKMEDESDGTQKIFSLAFFWLPALASGKVLVVDELEASLHPLLSRRLVELFHDPRHNKRGAQLIFASHDNTLLDSKLFRRDQIWFTERDRGGASHLFSLYDFKKKPRKDEAIGKGYLAGRYGAIPILEEAGME